MNTQELYNNELQDRIRGCLIGGAVGDALGYSVEFINYNQIIDKYGEKGITRYDLNSNGVAEISDDTQMTLYTANGILIDDIETSYKVFCTLRHFDNLEAAIISAVNHSGDSDSTGAICGNLIGAIYGYNAIPIYYKQNLELHDVILNMAYILSKQI